MAVDGARPAVGVRSLETLSLVEIRVQGEEDRVAGLRPPKSFRAPSLKDPNPPTEGESAVDIRPVRNETGPLAGGRPTMKTAIWLILPVAYARLKD